jgi:hypothetical protein
MFSLVKESVRLVHAHDRMEHHGDERKLAIDLSLELTTSNAILHKLAPNLKDSFYMQDDGAVADLINPDHKPKLRNPLIVNPLKFDLELPCVRFGVLADGANDEEIIFLDAKCNKFSLTLKEGGTVMVGFRIQKSLVDIDDLSKLKLLQEETIKVNLEVQEEEVPKQDAPAAGQTGGDGANVLPLFPGQAASAQDDPEPSAEELAEDEAARQLGMGITEDQEFNELYATAAAFVRGRKSVSISVVKRELKIEAHVVSRLLDRMGSEGIVGEPADNGVREVFAVPAASGA